MNLVLLFDDDFIGAARVRLGGRRLRHVTEVHRAAVGETLRVGRLGGLLGTGRIVRLDGEALEMEVVLDTPPPPPVDVVLLLALPRPKSLARIVRGAAACGVKHLFLLHTWRVEKSYWSSPKLAPAALREQLLLGLEQGGDTILPAVEQRRRFKPFAEDELPALVAGRRALVAHPLAAAECPRAVTEPLILAVGPEGGFTAYEVELLARIGFSPVHLGPRILPVEQAIPTLLGRLL